jgi:hypothetical protein
MSSEQKRTPLCTDARSGKPCRKYPCTFSHIPCTRCKDGIIGPKCFFAHQAGWKVLAQESTSKTGPKKYVGQIASELLMKPLLVVKEKQKTLCFTLMSNQNETESQKQFNQVNKAIFWAKKDLEKVLALLQELEATQKSIEANNSKLLSSSASDTSSRDEEDVDKMLNELVLGDNEPEVQPPNPE